MHSSRLAHRRKRNRTTGQAMVEAAIMLSLLSNTELAEYQCEGAQVP